MELYPSGSFIADRYEVAQGPNEKPSLKGGMGLVYLCFDHGEQLPVALKTFRPELLPDRPARDRFLREGSTWVALGRHPHIVRCHQVVRVGDGREVYLVLELVAKEESCADASLRSWLAPSRSLPVEQALLFALQVARGMAHAVRVQPGLVHRDLKPENLLVGADKLPSGINRLRITDFGLAAVVQGLERSHAETPSAMRRAQLTHGIAGTPLYMAPEQWRGQGICLQTDVYALGCILFELLAGQPAVEGHTLAALEWAHCAGQVRPLPCAVPGQVSEVVWRCLAGEAGARYGNWEEVGEALAGVYAAVVGRAAPLPSADDGRPAGEQERAEQVATGWSYSEIGASYLDLGQAEIAVRYFEQARKTGAVEGEPLLESAGLGNMGIAFKDLGQASAAIDCYEQALAIDRKIGDLHGEGTVLSNLGNVYATLGDAHRAISYYQQALTIHRQLGDRNEEENALANLGVAYDDLDDLRRAIAFYEQALAIDLELDDRRGQGTALGNLGVSYFRLGETLQAIGYFEQALAIYRELGDRGREGGALGNLGIAYRNLGHLRRAIAYQEMCLAICCEVGDRRSEGMALMNLGNAYLQVGDTRAMEYLQRAGVILETIGDVANATLVSFNLAWLLFQQGSFAEALPYATRADQVFRQIGRVQFAQRAHSLLAQIRSRLSQ